jgi:hypothetical protein
MEEISEMQLVMITAELFGLCMVPHLWNTMVEKIQMGASFHKFQRKSTDLKDTWQPMWYATEE